MRGRREALGSYVSPFQSVNAMPWCDAPAWESVIAWQAAVIVDSEVGIDSAYAREILPALRCQHERLIGTARAVSQLRVPPRNPSYRPQVKATCCSYPAPTSAESNFAPPRKEVASCGGCG